MDVEPAAIEVLRAEFGCTEFTRHWTEGRTVVVEAGADCGRAVLKASAEHDVRVEANVCRIARAAGVVPEVLAEGHHPDLPGGRWFVMRRARGVIWSPDESDRDVPPSLASALFAVHGVKPGGYGELGLDCLGRKGSWAEWVLAEVDAATAALRAAGYLSARQSAAFVGAYRRCSWSLAEGSLLHADLDPSEVFIEPSTGEVLGIVDWGDAIVGDPVMDLARFAAGGPAGDERPAQLQPRLIRAYELLAGPLPQERLALYRLLWSLRHAKSYLGDPDEQGWTPGLVQQAIDRLPS